MGWETTSKDGVFKKSCKLGECDTGKIYGDQKGAMLMIWRRDRPCGDIYGRVNILNESNVVIGYANDVSHGDLGDKVQLTFSSNQDFSKMRLTELLFH